MEDKSKAGLVAINTSKVLLIAGIIILLLSIVMAYANQSQTFDYAPKYNYSKAHCNWVSEEIKEMKSYDFESDEIDSLMFKITEELSFLLSDSLISKEQKDKLCKNYLPYYVSHFTDWSNGYFKRNVWVKNSIEWINAMTKFLLDQKEYLTSSSDLEFVKKVCDNYFQACTIIEKYSYSTIDYDIRSLDQILVLQKAPMINNCTYIREKLSSLPKTLHDWLQTRMDRLSNFHNYETEEDCRTSLIQMKNWLGIYKWKLLGNSTDANKWIKEIDNYLQSLNEYGYY